MVNKKLLQEIEQQSKRIHRLKVWPEYYKAIDDLKKSFEVRKNDRDFQVGDCLILEEWNPETGQYSGDWIAAEISYILHGGQLGVEAGYCVIGFV